MTPEQEAQAKGIAEWLRKRREHDPHLQELRRMNDNLEKIADYLSQLVDKK